MGEEDVVEGGCEGGDSRVGGAGAWGGIVQADAGGGVGEDEGEEETGSAFVGFEMRLY